MSCASSTVYRRGLSRVVLCKTEQGWGRQYAETGAYDKARAELSKLLQSDPKNTKAPGQMDNLLLPVFLDNQNAIYCQVVECLFDAAGPADFQILDALILP
jgi:hypothetical protein